MLASHAGAQATQSELDPDPIYLEEGEAAPFAGDLWPVIRSIRMALRAETCEARATIDLDHQQQRAAIELDAERAIAKAHREADAERIRILTAALEAAEPWYRSPAFVATVTAVVTLALVVVTGVILEATLGATARAVVGF